MERIISNGRTFFLHEYVEEKEFEQHVIKNVKEIFGPYALYIDIKKRIEDEEMIEVKEV